MDYFKVRFSLNSSVLTPFQSDIIFGHLAWAWRYLRGEPKLKELLSLLEDNPVLISDAFPFGKLPKPNLKPVPADKLRTLASEMGKKDGEFNKAGMIEYLTKFKDFKKIPYIPQDEIDIIRGSLSPNCLLKCLMKTGQQLTWNPVDEAIGHNTINRFSNMVSQSGGFHPKIETFYPKNTEFWCWIAGDYWSQDDLRELWEYIEHSGFGADSSTGKGRIKIVSIAKDSLEFTEDMNAVMSLSTFIPGKDCPTDVLYEPLVKFGRLGNIYSKRKNFYKSALMMLKPGAIIKHKWKPGDVLGCIVNNINYDSEVVQYAHVFPYPVRLEDQ